MSGEGVVSVWLSFVGSRRDGRDGFTHLQPSQSRVGLGQCIRSFRRGRHHLPQLVDLGAFIRHRGQQGKKNIRQERQANSKRAHKTLPSSRRKLARTNTQDQLAHSLLALQKKQRELASPGIRLTCTSILHPAALTIGS